MKDHLVIVAPTTEDMEMGTGRAVFDGMRNWAMPGEANDWDMDSMTYHKDVTSWYVEESDVAACAAKVTGYYPGRDVYVMKLTAVHYRPLAPVSVKAVTKDGILPV